MRVHELAKELGVSSKAVMDLLASMKIQLKSHSSTLDDATVERVRRNVKWHAEPKAAEPARVASARGASGTCRGGSGARAGGSAAQRAASQDQRATSPSAPTRTRRPTAGCACGDRHRRTTDSWRTRRKAGAQWRRCRETPSR